MSPPALTFAITASGDIAHISLRRVRHRPPIHLRIKGLRAVCPIPRSPLYLMCSSLRSGRGGWRGVVNGCAGAPARKGQCAQKFRTSPLVVRPLSFIVRVRGKGLAQLGAEFRSAAVTVANPRAACRGGATQRAAPLRSAPRLPAPHTARADATNGLRLTFSCPGSLRSRCRRSLASLAPVCRYSRFYSQSVMLNNIRNHLEMSRLYTIFIVFLII